MAMSETKPHESKETGKLKRPIYYSSKKTEMMIATP
jgi:hypothetical protein